MKLTRVAVQKVAKYHRNACFPKCEKEICYSKLKRQTGKRADTKIRLFEFSFPHKKKIISKVNYNHINAF